MRHVLISGSILDADFSCIIEQIREAASSGLDILHFDIADTSFTPTVSFGPKIAALIAKKVNIPCEAHLMVANPEKIITQLAEPSIETIYFHYEATITPFRVISQIKKQGSKPGVAINPSTSIRILEHVLPEVDAVLVLLVEPGIGGQKMMKNLLSKITQLRQIREREGYSYLIAADGGIKPYNIGEVVKTGIDIAIVGSAIFAQPNPGEAVKQLRSEIEKTLSSKQ